MQRIFNFFYAALEQEAIKSSTPGVMFLNIIIWTLILMVDWFLHITMAEFQGESDVKNDISIRQDDREKSHKSFLRSWKNSKLPSPKFYLLFMGLFKIDDFWTKILVWILRRDVRGVFAFKQEHQKLGPIHWLVNNL